MHLARRKTEPRPLLQRRWFLRELVETILFVAVVYVLVEMAAPRFLVEGPSMQPTFHNDQRLIISRIHYLVGQPQRGDIVVFNSPRSRLGDPPLIKRAIGLPGDTIEVRPEQRTENGTEITIAHIYLNGELLNETYINERNCTSSCQAQIVTLGPEEYFVMGDNRNHSNDSRAFGTVRRDSIIGEALIRYWPPEDWAYLERFRFNAP